MRRTVRLAATLAFASLAGCGLALDLDPVPPPPVEGIDAGHVAQDAGKEPDAGAGIDAGVVAVDAEVTASDAGTDAMRAFIDAATFIDGAMRRDAGPACPSTPCAYLPPQCGCELGETCVYDSLGGRPMCQTAGMVPEGSGCTATTDCAAGLVCVSYEVGSPGVCTHYCSFDSDCGGGTAVCAATLFGAPVCTTDCNPVGGGMSTCPTGLRCSYDTSLRGTVCRELTGAADGAACFADADCRAGSVCIGAPGAGVCRHLCRTAMLHCSGSETCRLTYPPGAPTIGYCISS